ncbi:MAG: hypothetical protein M1269_11890 [Chloroflexi bacterium]|nr:hypothetical protein [Chloroflexota bacterium]
MPIYKQSFSVRIVNLLIFVGFFASCCVGLLLFLMSIFANSIVKISFPNNLILLFISIGTGLMIFFTMPPLFIEELILAKKVLICKWIFGKFEIPLVDILYVGSYLDSSDPFLGLILHGLSWAPRKLGITGDVTRIHFVRQNFFQFFDYIDIHEGSKGYQQFIEALKEAVNDAYR